MSARLSRSAPARTLAVAPQVPTPQPHGREHPQDSVRIYGLAVYQAMSDEKERDMLVELEGAVETPGYSRSNQHAEPDP